MLALMPVHAGAVYFSTLGEGNSYALDVGSIKRIDFYQRNNSNYLPLPNHLYVDNVRLGELEP